MFRSFISSYGSKLFSISLEHFFLEVLTILYAEGTDGGQRCEGPWTSAARSCFNAKSALTDHRECLYIKDLEESSVSPMENFQFGDRFTQSGFYKNSSWNSFHQQIILHNIFKYLFCSCNSSYEKRFADTSIFPKVFKKLYLVSSILLPCKITCILKQGSDDIYHSGKAGVPVM